MVTTAVGHAAGAGPVRPGMELRAGQRDRDHHRQHVPGHARQDSRLRRRRHLPGRSRRRARLRPDRGRRKLHSALRNRGRIGHRFADRGQASHSSHAALGGPARNHTLRSLTTERSCPRVPSRSNRSPITLRPGTAPGATATGNRPAAPLPRRPGTRYRRRGRRRCARGPVRRGRKPCGWCRCCCALRRPARAQDPRRLRRPW